jgi:hypothetical protein
MPVKFRNTLFFIVVLGSTGCSLIVESHAMAWGFAAHRYINESAVYALPSPLREFFEYHQQYLKDRAVFADQRRSWDPLEAPCHFMDVDRWEEQERWQWTMHWDSAVQCYSEDFLRSRGILPWHTLRVFRRLVWAFEQGNTGYILRTAADLGHYLADAHVPLHLCSNYNGQWTGQHGLHALLESRIPEYFGDTMRLSLRRATPFQRPEQQILSIMKEAYAPINQVFECECRCRMDVPLHEQYAPIRRGNRLVRQESLRFVQCYHLCLGGLMGRQLSASVTHVADWWLSAWLAAGQPRLQFVSGQDGNERAIEGEDEDGVKSPNTEGMAPAQEGSGCGEEGGDA